MPDKQCFTRRFDRIHSNNTNWFTFGTTVVLPLCFHQSQTICDLFDRSAYCLVFNKLPRHDFLYNVTKKNKWMVSASLPSWENLLRSPISLRRLLERRAVALSRRVAVSNGFIYYPGRSGIVYKSVYNLSTISRICTTMEIFEFRRLHKLHLWHMIDSHKTFLHESLISIWLKNP